MQSKKLGLILSLIVFMSVIAVVAPAIPIWGAPPTVVLSQFSGPAGSIVEVTGTSFNGTAAQATITFGVPGSTYTAYVSSAIPINGGTFYAGFQVPNFPRGNYTVTINTSIPETATSQFQIIPTITLKSTSGQAGNQINISGTGFSAGSTISGFFDNTVVNTTTADPYGIFSNLVITVPETYKGLHIIKAADPSGPSSPVNYSVNPKITVIPANAAVGGQVNVSGSGFTASSPLSFSLDNVNVSTTVTAGAAGSFSATALTIPPIFSGEHTLKTTDNTGLFATAVVNTKGAFSINPQSGPARTVVTISGIGFEAGKNIIITFNGVNIGTNPATVTSDAIGNFSASITIPSTASGTFPIAINDGTTSLTANFTASALAKATQTQGPVGGNIPINGNGFNAGTTISIKYDGVQIGTAIADNNGAFSAIFPAPVSAAGEHKIIATDGVNSINFIFTITPAAQASVDAGRVGTDIVVNGTAFTPNGTITIKYGNNQVAAVTADSKGVFSSSFKAPASKGGKYVITATDGVTTIPFDFTMETIAPAVPGLVSPAKDAKVEPLAEFQWAPVTDPSGVTYTFQLSKDTDSSVLLIDKPGLTTTKYQISENEKLQSTGKDKPYYWRVRAIDGAYNESAWSTPQPFVVGMTLPFWIWYPIGVLVVALVFILGFLIGRRVERIKAA
jgi:hypothetical protein